MAARRCLMQMLVLAVLLAPAGLANGAGNDSDETAGSGYTHILDTLHALRRELESKRRVVIREAMQFDAAQAKVFWPLYDRYREDTGKLDDRRDRLLTHYLAALDSMTDARADALMREQFGIDRDRLQLRERYYRRFKRLLPARRVVRFFQLDRELDLAVELNHARSLPLVE